ISISERSMGLAAAVPAYMRLHRRTPSWIRMKIFPIITMLAVGACGPRQVEVRTAPPAPAEVALQVTNNLTQSVNVYVTYNGSDQFVQQVRPGTSLKLPVR